MLRSPPSLAQQTPHRRLLVASSAWTMNWIDKSAKSSKVWSERRTGDCNNRQNTRAVSHECRLPVAAQPKTTGGVNPNRHSTQWRLPLSPLYHVLLRQRQRVQERVVDSCWHQPPTVVPTRVCRERVLSRLQSARHSQCFPSSAGRYWHRQAGVSPIPCITELSPLPS